MTSLLPLRAVLIQISQEKIYELIDDHRQKDWFSDRSYVNVLQLNLALDKLEA